MKKTLFLLLICTYNLLLSQENIINKYSNYFENTREVPFLHLNKTTFLTGEEIWFKAYIQEQNSQKLHPTTTNLYVSVFEESGKFKEQHLIHIKKGVGKGNILIDSTYTQKNYYLKASTKWMKNFKEDNAYYQKITIASKEAKSYVASDKNSYEFKLFPEGGNLIANTMNSIGILLKDSNGKGLKIEKGVIKDENNQVIRYFNTNSNGMNKVRLFIKENATYTFSTTLFNGTKIDAKTPKPNYLGTTINIFNEEEKIGINVLTNEHTLKTLKNKKFKILIHNTRSYKTYDFEFSKNKEKYIFLFDKEDLSSGVNIVTLFDENNMPVSERLLFNHLSSTIQNLNINTNELVNDSVRIAFHNASNEKVFLSASFLPLKTKAYNPDNNILSSFLLKPYVKGTIQNGKNYFKNLKDKKQQRNLDLLLLTQGWSKYNWSDIFNGVQKINYPFENGIDLTARFNEPLKKNQSVLLFSEENNLVRTFKPIEKTWFLEKSFIKKNSNLEFAIKNKDGHLRKIAPALSFSNARILDRFNDKNRIPTFTMKEPKVINFKTLKDDFEDLDEVEVKANRRVTAHKDFPQTGAYRHVGKKDLPTGIGMTIFDYIRFKTPNNRRITTFFLDGQDIIREPYLADGLYMDQIKEIFFGADISNLNLGYAYYIFTLSPSEYRNQKNTTSNVKLKLGFNIEKEYYTPKYTSFNSKPYKDYGAIFWDPNINISPLSYLDFIMPSNIQNDVVIYIEGISESGKLISKKHIISKDDF